MIVVVVAVAMIVSCTGSGRYKLILGRSFFPPEAVGGIRDRNLLGTVELGERFRIQGVYSLDWTISPTTAAVSYLEDDGGRANVNLADSLAVTEGTVVEVWGKVIKREVHFKGIGELLTRKYLQPEGCKIIFDTATIREEAQREYVKIRQSLQEKITLEGSKLELSLRPRWQVEWFPDDERFVFSSRSYDLMFVAKVDFVFEGSTPKLRQVYAVEWFKGER